MILTCVISTAMFIIVRTNLIDICELDLIDFTSDWLIKTFTISLLYTVKGFIKLGIDNIIETYGPKFLFDPDTLRDSGVGYNLGEFKIKQYNNSSDNISLSNGASNGTSNGTFNGTPNGASNGTPNGTSNGTSNGTNYGAPHVMPNDMPNHPLYETPEGMYLGGYYRLTNRIPEGVDPLYGRRYNMNFSVATSETPEMNINPNTGYAARRWRYVEGTGLIGEVDLPTPRTILIRESQNSLVPGVYHHSLHTMFRPDQRDAVRAYLTSDEERANRLSPENRHLYEGLKKTLGRVIDYNNNNENS